MRRPGSSPLAHRLVRLVLIGCATACLVRPAEAVLGTPGFRVVPVAHSDYPVSAMAVAPDGRLFAAVQALGRPAEGTRGPAEIRVYSQYRSIDGSLMDEGTLWATVDDVRPSNNEEGLLGIALAPDFPTSRLVYVHVTTSMDGPDGSELRDQEIRVYREKPDGTGEYLGTVLTGLELANPSSSRNGGHLTFGADGCLYLGQGDGGSGNRWSAQTFVGTDGMGSTEANARCADVCLGTAEYPERTIDHNGLTNHAGKVLRMAVEGPSLAQGAAGAPFSAQPFVFGAGLRNPTALLAHPLTGQLYAGDRGDSLEAEVNVVDMGTNLGWPCLEGTQVKESCAVNAGQTADAILANHPSWRRPLVVHPGSNEHVTALAAYTGLAYPAEFYGDVFYLLRSSARIYRIDLVPPCFVPGTDTQAPLPFHDEQDDDEFFAYYDVDDDGDPNFVSLTTLSAIAQGPSPQGEVLYLAANQNASNELTQDAVIFRLEYATVFTPYDGPTGRVADECFGAYENPFRRPTCLPPGGPCPGAPDGTPCDDGDACNGAETCQAGVCNHGAAAPDGTACTPANACRGAGTCEVGYCESAAPAPDGTPCPDADPCDGLETCLGGVCQPGDGDPEPLAVKTLKMTGGPAGSLTLNATVPAALPLDPAGGDAMTLVVSDTGGTVYTGTLAHPAARAGWRGAGANRQRYFDSTGALDHLKEALVKRGKKKTRVQLSGDGMDLSGLDEPSVTARVVVGQQCFEASVGCVPKGARLVCKP
ncbi:MAG TPA: PQQ-dependent sugar dehydrogenase [Candidatus Limnocylindria bacterium]|nr:PQQ-dependent sugar dehydrogenase [Candidatus Limnocylindria bacterium]